MRRFKLLSSWSSISSHPSTHLSYFIFHFPPPSSPQRFHNYTRYATHLYHLRPFTALPLLKPFTTHFLRGTWTLILPLRTRKSHPLPTTPINFVQNSSSAFKPFSGSAGPGQRPAVAEVLATDGPLARTVNEGTDAVEDAVANELFRVG